MPMPICNRFQERQANNCKITTFTGVRFLMPSSAGLLERIKLRLGPSNSKRLMLKIFLRSLYPCLFQLISTQFAPEMCFAARNRQKSIKTPILAFKVIKGH